MRSFKNISNVIRISRNFGEKRMTQGELSKALGYKNSQFISNVERGLCSIPMRKIDVTAEALGIMPSKIKDAMVTDFKNTLNAMTKSEAAPLPMDCDIASEDIDFRCVKPEDC